MSDASSGTSSRSRSPNKSSPHKANAANFTPSSKLTRSPPSTGASGRERSRSNSNSSIQHDQIPINSTSSQTYSSASYKQELMDSSVLLDNINDILSIWDSHQSNTHSLQPFSPNAGLFSPPSFPSMVPDDPILMTSTANTASSMQPSAHLRPGDNGKRKKYNNKHNKYHPATSPANYHKSRSKHSKNNKEEASKLHRNKSQPSSTASPTLVTMAGPHQTFYIKDDTSIHSNNRSKNTASSASNKSSKHSHSRHRGHHHHNISRTPINITNVEEIPSFIKRNDRRLNLLKEMIELKRLELERISARHDCTLSSIISLYISAGNNIIFL